MNAVAISGIGLPGTLRLVPPDSRREELGQYYEKMKETIFGEPPAFVDILAIIADVERAANSAA